MPSLPRQYRVVVQRFASDGALAFRVVAYSEGIASANSSEFESLSALVDALDSSGLGITLHLWTAGSIVFAGEVAMNESQLQTLRLMGPE